MNKKAEEQILYEMIIHLVLLALIVITIFAGIIKIKDNTLYLQREKVKDFSLLYDSLTLTKEDFKISYNLPKNLVLALKPNCLIEIKEPNKALPTTYYCTTYNPKINFEPNNNNPNNNPNNNQPILSRKND